MVFSSLTFLCIFFPLVFILYQFTHKIWTQNLLLLIASLLFYAYGEPYYILLMLVSILANYTFGRLIENSNNSNGKIWMVLAVIVNIGLLFIFKYLDMAITWINWLFKVNIPLVNIALPVGISFFTFQALSYVIDVYRKEVPAQKNVWKVMLYISFFPQLIAGPIVKYHDIDKEINQRECTTAQTANGLRRFLVGLSKKVLIANPLALVSDTIFGMPSSNILVGSAWLASVAYMFQIYFDFSGYSDMAIGMGEIFGFHFKENFNYPYISFSIKEFWRRWHISLSTWFKEYLYIPLGGNRKGKLRTYFNKFIVFFCTGLWHGANLTFLIWGLWHGLFIILEDIFSKIKLPRVISYFGTMLIVLIGWTMFRADTVGQGFFMLQTMFLKWNQIGQSDVVLSNMVNPYLIFVLILAIVCSVPLKKWTSSFIAYNSNWMIGTSYGISFVLLLICILSLSSGTYNPFIYFRF